MENQFYKVSVIVPLYNQQRYLKSCLRSICRQTYRKLEILVINDGSTDDSPIIARTLAKDDARIKVIDKPNGGVASARREGLLNATGEFVAFVDNDDLMTPQAVEIMLNAMVQHDVDMVVGNARYMLGLLKWGSISGAFPIHQVVTQPELYDKYYVNFFGQGSFPVDVWGKLYRKSAIDLALKKTDLYSDRIRHLADDLYFNMKLFPYLRSMYVTDEVVYYYRYGGTVSHYNKNYPEVFTLTEERLKLLDEKGYDKGYGSLFIEYSNMVYYHAQQMLEFKIGTREDVIAFFKRELTSRSFMPRMKSFFAQNKTENEGVNLMLSNDYAGMCDHTIKLLHECCGNISYRVKRLLLAVVERL